MANSPCSHDKAYMSIIISVLPLWAILTTLIVFALIAFHRSLRIAKIYDNCTKQSANYIYHIDLRTGDTSSTYNRRKTTVTIDIFDENQATLARIAIPGHVIFGRKDAPIDLIEDERFFDLRVTRLWLYRATKLKKVTTIRLTHTCLEPEARIMVYGVEIRTNDPERRQLFFPVMNYITAYGTVNRPNACFDTEPLGSISALGGSQPEQSTISDQLTFFDYTLLVYLFSSLVFHFSVYDSLADSFKDPAQAAYKGAILGCCCFSIILIIGIAMRYLVKHYYSLNIGTGFWGYAYYVMCFIILLPATGLWIYTAYYAYKHLCSNEFGTWVLTISVAILESGALALTCSLLSWAIQVCSPSYTEQYVLPEDINTIQNSKNRSGQNKLTGSSGGKPGSNPLLMHGAHHQQAQTWQPPLGASAVTAMSNGSGGNAIPIQYIVPPGTNTYMGAASPNAYNQPYVMNPVMAQTGGYKAYQQQAPPGSGGPGPVAAGYHQPYAPYYGGAAGPQAHHHPQSPQSPSPPMSPTDAMNLPKTYAEQDSPGIKTVKKVGSTESTGSTYFQQLMKNKGGVKSISQYGELMKQKKPKK